NPESLEREFIAARSGDKAHSVEAVHARLRPQPQITIGRLTDRVNRRLGKSLRKLPLAKQRLGDSALRVKGPGCFGKRSDNEHGHQCGAQEPARIASPQNFRAAPNRSLNHEPRPEGMIFNYTPRPRGVRSHEDAACSSLTSNIERSTSNVECPAVAPRQKNRSRSRFVASRNANH